MKIVLLGAKGNLGSQFLEQLNYKGINKYEIENIDLNNISKSLDIVFSSKPDLLINSMAYNDVDKCESDKGEYELALKLNWALPRELALRCSKENTTLVHFSSDYVFGAYEGKDLEWFKKNGGFEEDNKPRPNSKYAETKLYGEREILKTKNLKYYLVRTSKLFGPKGVSSYAKPSFFDTMLDLSIKKDELKVVNDERSCFTYTPDLAKATIALVEKRAKSGIYHIVNEGAATWYEGVIELVKISKLKTKIIPVSSSEFPRPASRPRYSVLKNTKTKQLRDYREALREYLSNNNS